MKISKQDLKELQESIKALDDEPELTYDQMTAAESDRDAINRQKVQEKEEPEELFQTPKVEESPYVQAPTPAKETSEYLTDLKKTISAMVLFTKNSQTGSQNKELLSKLKQLETLSVTTKPLELKPPLPRNKILNKMIKKKMSR